MLTLVKQWVEAYKPLRVFIGHKSIHIGVGMGVMLIVSYIGNLEGLLACLIIAIGKEVADRYKMKKANSVMPLSFSMFDVLVTMVGGVLGLVSIVSGYMIIGIIMSVCITVLGISLLVIKG